MIRVLTSLLVSATLTFIGTAALAQSTLRSSVNVTGPYVTIGDFYTNAGNFADTPIFRSPDLGTTGNISALIVAQQAQSAGFVPADTNGLSNVSVHRLSVLIDEELILSTLRPTLAEHIGTNIEELKITLFPSTPLNQQADANVLQPLSLNHLTWSARTGRFTALMSIVQEGQTRTISAIGSAEPMVFISTLARHLNRGDIITTTDIREERKPASRFAGREFLSVSELIGMEVRRNMRTGSALTPRDVRAPILVERGAKVTVLYRIPGMNITTQGISRAAGGKNDLIEIQNPVSKKIILAEVIGRNTAIISTSNNHMATLVGAN